MEVPTEAEVNAGLEERIITILRQQAIEYNNTNNQYKIDLNRSRTKLELAISLWTRNVSIQPIFGEPYDTTFRDYCQATLYKKPQLIIPPIDHSLPYLILRYSKIILGVLIHRINQMDLSPDGNVYWLNSIQKIFNEMGYQGDLYYPNIKPLLLKLSDIQITYTAIKFDTVGIFPEMELRILLNETFC